MAGDPRARRPDRGAVDLDVESQETRPGTRSRPHGEAVETGGDPRQGLLDDTLLTDVEREAALVVTVGDRAIRGAHRDRPDERRPTAGVKIAVGER